jgi:RNA polymerase subunit RPABC4/transcription elongation factor Spt4
MEAAIARGLQLLIALGGAYLLALWFALIVWTFQDIQTRSRSVVAQIFSTLVVVLFFVPGVLIYLILRPRDTLDDAFQRSLEEEYLLQDLDELLLCPTCQHQVESDFIFCPHCRSALRTSCVGCGRLIDLRWDICPYCGEEQYPEELPLQISEDWRPAEREGVGRLFDQARDRLAGYRSKSIGHESNVDDQYLPVEPWTEPTTHRTMDWDLEEEEDLRYQERRRDPYRTNGSADEEDWRERDDAESDEPVDHTDELPSRPNRY